MKQPPCHNCQTRHELCHMDCDGYKLFQAECRKVREARKSDILISEYHSSAVQKAVKSCNNRRHSILA